MARWKYTLHFGKNLREAIDAEDIEATVQCLIACYRELLNKLSNEDKDWKEFAIEDAISSLECYDIYEEHGAIDYYLEEFYDICDDVRAWVGGI